MIPPPAVVGEARQGLLRIYWRIQGFSDRVLLALGDQMVCREGCGACCRVLPRLRTVEAAYVLEGARQLPVGAVSLVWAALERSRGGCALFQGGICLCYEHRPAACRVQGLPLLRWDGDRTLLHHCPLNFSEMEGDDIPPALVLDEFRLERGLDEVDTAYRAAGGLADARVEVAELLRVGLQP